MTLGRLVVAWLAVAAWTMVATFAVPLLVAALARPPGQTGVWASTGMSVVWWRPIEALALTLLAALWFESLGSGGWWLLFLLVGFLAIGPRWVSAFAQAERRLRMLQFVGVCADLARYVVAGAVLAWILR